jgi:hypothetical protein
MVKPIVACCNNGCHLIIVNNGKYFITMVKLLQQWLLHNQIDAPIGSIIYRVAILIAAT